MPGGGGRASEERLIILLDSVSIVTMYFHFSPAHCVSTATIFRKEYDDMTSKSFLPRSKKEVRDAGLSSTYGRRTLADPKASYDMSLEELKQGDSSIWKSKYM
jgi:hypothetical protein